MMLEGKMPMNMASLQSSQNISSNNNLGGSPIIQ